MQIFYQGTNITAHVEVVRCIHRDVSGGRCDSLEIELENAAAWHRWQPKRDDIIEVQMNGYSTGALYLNSILPENGKYRMIANSLPGRAKRKAYASYEEMSLADIVSVSAAECGLDGALFGIEGSIRYPYLMRNKESAPAFLNRLLRCEGAVLKTLNGRLTAISIEYAQNLDVGQTIELAADQQGVRYLKRDDVRMATMTIKTPYATGTASDASSPDGQNEVYTDEYPAVDNAQAARWARGLLLHHNRASEELTLNSEFNPGFTAMTRVNIVGATEAAGEWLIDEVEHDFFNRKSRAKLLRCIDTIW